MKGAIWEEWGRVFQAEGTANTKAFRQAWLFSVGYIGEKEPAWLLVALAVSQEEDDKALSGRLNHSSQGYPCPCSQDVWMLPYVGKGDL